MRKSLADWSAVVLVPDMDAAIALANRVAPEHLEVLMREPWSVLPRIRHAGAVFLGPYAPEPLGDYFAGPNHVLPTLGTARFSSALSVQTFCKRTSIIAASPAFAAANADAVARARPHGAARSPCPLDGMPEAIIPSTFNPRQRSKDVT